MHEAHYMDNVKQDRITQGEYAYHDEKSPTGQKYILIKEMEQIQFDLANLIGIVNIASIFDNMMKTERKISEMNTLSNILIDFFNLFKEWNAIKDESHNENFMLEFKNQLKKKSIALFQELQKTKDGQKWLKENEQETRVFEQLIKWNESS